MTEPCKNLIDLFIELNKEDDIAIPFSDLQYYEDQLDSLQSNGMDISIDLKREVLDELSKY